LNLFFFLWNKIETKIGILFAYALSLLSDRHLLIRMTVPCNIEEFLLPNKVDWLIKNVHDLDKLSKHNIPIDELWNGKLNESKLTQIDFLTYNSEIDVLIIKTGLNLIKHLTINPKHHFKIKNQFGYSLNEFNIEHLVHKWFNHLFKFTDQLKQTYENKLKLVKPQKFTWLVCAQIRLGGEYGSQFMQLNETNLFWNFIKTNLTSQRNNTDTVIFITADKDKIIKDARNQFNSSTKLIAFEENSFHINFWGDKTCASIGDLIVEWLLLGHCGAGVVSHSGFGLLGILNRQANINNFENNFYVYTNPIEIRKNFWNRNIYLEFYPYNHSFLYLEFN